MVAYIIRRLAQALVVLIIVSIIIFFTMRFLPGDPILMLVTSSQLESHTEQQIEELKHEFGMDRPLVIQYFDWVGGVLHGDLGMSILNRRPVGPDIMSRFVIS